MARVDELKHQRKTLHQKIGGTLPGTSEEQELLKQLQHVEAELKALGVEPSDVSACDEEERQREADADTHIADVSGNVDIKHAGDDIVGGDKIEATSHQHFYQGTSVTPRIPLQRPPRVEHFTNRENELTQLLRDLQPGRVVTLCGPGGIGKTALAAEAVQRIEPDRFPDGTIFYSFYGQPDINLAFEHIVTSFGLDPRPSPATAALQVLRRKRALLILDGTEEAENLAAVLQVRGNCGVLVTTRQHTDAVAECQDIRPLPTAEAVTLLQSWSKNQTSDVSVSRHICELIGNVPLAVRLAGRHLFETGDPATEYVAWLTTTPLDALDFGQRKGDSVLVLVKRSVNQVSEAARQVLAVIGVLAFAPFSRTVLEAALPDRNSQKRLHELLDYGLLTCANQRYVMSHALIHTYARERLTVTAEVMQDLAAYYTEFATEQGQQGMDGYARLDTERAHLMKVLERCQEQEEWHALSDLVWAVSHYLDIRGYWTERLSALEMGVIAAQKQGNREDEGRLLNNIGCTCLHQSDYATAVQYLEQSLAIQQEIGDKAGEGVTCWNIGNIYLQQGNLEKAEEYMSRTVKIDEEIGHPDLEQDRAALERIRKRSHVLSQEGENNFVKGLQNAVSGLMRSVNSLFSRRWKP